jgi:diguanylate cyclase (GGDEF)-like protein
VANRRQFNEKMDQEWNRLKREGLPLSLLMCDVDDFKAYNDTYGHQNGDRCLRSIADAIKKTAKRTVDLVARYGGEEFAVIMPNTNQLGASRVAESVRVAVEEIQIPNKASSVSDFITLSIGVSSMIPDQDLSSDALIKDADNALYSAKKQGRNRVVVSENACRRAENNLSWRFSSPAKNELTSPDSEKQTNTAAVSLPVK